jgi:transposase-like protein
MKDPKSLQEAILYFADYENCRQFMIQLRWSDGKVRCPACGSEKVTYLANARLYKCYGDHPKPKFSLKVGTVFEDSAVTLDKWLCALWLIVNCKNGISSYEVAKDIGISQKSAWHLLHRIRFALHQGSFEKMLSGEVEADETFIGGKARNMHVEKRIRRITGSGAKDKVPVIGILERGKDGTSKVRTAVVPNRRKKALQAEVRKHVEAGSALYTDALLSYEGLAGDYAHQVVDHAVEYVNGKVHTNSLENFWSLLKRSISGTYVSVEPYHLFRYLDEQAYRFNNRGKEMNDFERFKLAASQIVGKRLTWDVLTGKGLDLQTRLTQ